MKTPLEPITRFEPVAAMLQKGPKMCLWRPHIIPIRSLWYRPCANLKWPCPHYIVLINQTIESILPLAWGNWDFGKSKLFWKLLFALALYLLTKYPLLYIPPHVVGKSEIYFSILFFIFFLIWCGHKANSSAFFINRMNEIKCKIYKIVNILWGAVWKPMDSFGAFLVFRPLGPRTLCGELVWDRGDFISDLKFQN